MLFRNPPGGLPRFLQPYFYRSKTLIVIPSIPTVNCPSQETEGTSTPTRPVDNVVIATKGLQDRNTNITAGTTVENKGKLILPEIFPPVQKHDIFLVKNNRLDILQGGTNDHVNRMEDTSNQD